MPTPPKEQTKTPSEERNVQEAINFLQQTMLNETVGIRERITCATALVEYAAKHIR